MWYVESPSDTLFKLGLCSIVCLFVCFICIPSPTRLMFGLLALSLCAFGSGCSLRPHKAGSDSNERAQSCCFIDLLHTHWQWEPGTLGQKLWKGRCYRRKKALPCTVSAPTPTGGTNVNFRVKCTQRKHYKERIRSLHALCLFKKTFVWQAGWCSPWLNSGSDVLFYTV